MKNIMESWRKFKIREQSQSDQNNLLLAACALFANKYIKGKEQEQLPVTIVLKRAEQVGDWFSGGKQSKPKKVRRNKSGSVSFHKVVTSRTPSGEKIRSIKRTYRTKQNKMNLMISALDSMLRLAKNSGDDPRKFSQKDSPESQYYNMIANIAKKLKNANPEQISKLAAIGSKTEIMGDSHVDSRLGTRRHNINKTSNNQSQNFSGSKAASNALVTTVEYLAGPLATKRPGDFAGLAQKAESEHVRMAAAFGEDGVIGTVEKGLDSTEMGKESPGEFDRRMKKAVGLGEA